jgi:hypothetical protein
MGVDYRVCPMCGEAFADCGHNGFCICDSWLCGSCYDDMVEKHGEIGEEHEKASWFGESAVPKCDLCDGSIVHDEDLLEFALKQLGKTYAELKEEFIRSK